MVAVGNVAYGGSGGAGPADLRSSRGTHIGGYAGSAQLSEERMWAWTSTDGHSWRLQRLRGVGQDLLTIHSASANGFVGIRMGRRTEPRIVVSADGVSWRRLVRLPAEVTLDSVVHLVATHDGYILAADTYRARKSTGPFLDAWTIGRDGSMVRVLEQARWQLLGLAVGRSTVVVTGQAYTQFRSDSRAAAFISLDAGRSFALSAGWPATRSTPCLESVAVRDKTIVAMASCADAAAPELLVAELP
jgi:hypothetical protein